jgi:excinuclease ABC subunit B
MQHNIVPQTIVKSVEEINKQTGVLEIKGTSATMPYVEPVYEPLAAAENTEEEFMSKPLLEKKLSLTKKQMQKAAKDMDFIEAARLRDEMFSLQKLLEDLG